MEPQATPVQNNINPFETVESSNDFELDMSMAPTDEIDF